MSKQQSNSKSKSKRTRRSFTDEFKIEAVKMVTEQGYKVSEVARSLDVNENLIHHWKANFDLPPRMTPVTRLSVLLCDLAPNLVPVGMLEIQVMTLPPTLYQLEC